MRKWLVLFTIIMAILAASLLNNQASGEGVTKIKVTPTMSYTVFYGYMDDLRTGDIIYAFDKDGVACGQSEVQTAGQYGFMFVYGDDPATKEVDEGASAGETITFKLLRQGSLTTLAPSQPESALFKGDMAEVKLDLTW